VVAVQVSVGVAVSSLYFLFCYKNLKIICKYCEFLQLNHAAAQTYAAQNDSRRLSEHFSNCALQRALFVPVSLKSRQDSLCN